MNSTPFSLFPSSSVRIFPVALLLLLAYLCPFFSVSAAEFTILGTERSDLLVQRDGAVSFRLETRAIGPNWNRANPTLLSGIPTETNQERIYEDTLIFTANPRSKKPVAPTIQLKQVSKQTSPRTLDLILEATPDGPFEFGLPDRKHEIRGTLALVLPPTPLFKKGKLDMTGEDKSKSYPLPPPPGNDHPITQAKLTTASGETYTFRFDPAVFIHRDQGELRFMTVSESAIQAGKTQRQRITLELPGALTFKPENQWVDLSDWFPVDVDNDFSKPSEISMEDWLEKPAGQRGWLKMDGGRLFFEDGTPFKMWGTNILRADNRGITRDYMLEAPAAAAHYGVNTNRLHAFAKPHNDKWAHMFKLMSLEDSFTFHEGHLDLFDLIFAESKKRGIYTGWSVFYGWFPSKTDIEEDRFLNWEEAQTMLRDSFPREGSFYASTAVMPDVQDLIIKWHVQLLNHVNPHTGLRYADDPALAFVELQNEENAYLGIRNLERILADAPTYRQNYYNRFADFLRERYSDQEGLREAWGDALRAEESLAQANITPFPAWYNPAHGTPGQRIADQYHFIYLTQQEYYLKFKAAVREAGYGGLLIGSCWQASDWIGHLYNIRLDTRVGMIDRHNYGRDHLDKPGTGLLSAGFQQVADVPFNFSEWGGDARVGQNITTPIMAFYGMGLQGWDGSQQFAWDHPGILPHDSTGINNSTNPFDNLAQYLTLGRSVLRGDVKEGAVAGLRRVSLPALKNTGDVGFHEEFSLLGNANHKSFQAAVPQESLVVGRVLLEYVDGPVDHPVTDNTDGFIDRENRVVRSNTGQLVWDASGQGWFSVNTPGTQAVIGNSGEQPHQFDTVHFNSASPYAHLYATALEKDADLATGKRILITALGRTAPKGTKFDALAYTPLERPENATRVPLLIEPVRATISLKRSDSATVTPLDQNGRKVPSLQPLTVRQQGDMISFDIDTAATRSVYFLVEFN